MTQEEFNSTQFHKGMFVEYHGQQREIVSIDFDENLIGIQGETTADCDWVRCENVKLIIN